MLDLTPLAQESDLTRARNPPRQGSGTHGTSWYFPSPRTPRPLPLLAWHHDGRMLQAPGPAGLGDHLPAGLSKHKETLKSRGRLREGWGAHTPFLWPNCSQEGRGRLTSTGPGGPGPRSETPTGAKTENGFPRRTSILTPWAPPRPCRTSPVASEGAWGVPRGTTSGGMDPLLRSHWKVTVGRTENKTGLQEQ